MTLKIVMATTLRYYTERISFKAIDIKLIDERKREFIYHNEAQT